MCYSSIMIFEVGIDNRTVALLLCRQLSFGQVARQGDVQTDLHRPQSQVHRVLLPKVVDDKVTVGVC